ncbi:hypothetical protein BS78_K149100 [Paspalum vaginatum]|uniref:Uncharacterized protein n=1 Tax=Paspalum vaginatum TaxID=158149 RepID=A0A9W7X8F5_9POAL|nr:hypothetical protein BS78_K149100 [Paspalum vaginatum]
MVPLPYKSSTTIADAASPFKIISSQLPLHLRRSRQPRSTFGGGVAALLLDQLSPKAGGTNRPAAAPRQAERHRR